MGGAYYPGRLNMPINEWLVGTVGRLEDKSGEPVGTCFLVRVHAEGDDSRDYGYVVTARHNLYQEDGETERVSLRVVVPIQGVDEPAEKTIRFDRWYRHTEDDVAAALWFLQDDPRPFNAIPLYDYAVDKAGIVEIRHGATAFYAGLLAEKAFRAMKEPMVMSANVGARFVKGVKYDPNEKHSLREAHLLDCRSRHGFSGSPVFVQEAYPGSRVMTLPRPWQQERPDADTLGGMHFFAALIGVFVGWAGLASVGVIAPVESVHELLEREDVMSERADLERERKKREDDEPLGAEPMSADYRREDFLSDLHKATRRLPEQSDPEESGTGA